MHPEKAILNIMNNSYISYRLQNGLFFCKRYQIYHNQMLIKKKHVYSALFHLESLLCLCSLLMIFAFREELRFTLLQFFAFFCCNEFFNQGFSIKGVRKHVKTHGTIEVQIQNSKHDIIMFKKHVF